MLIGVTRVVLNALFPVVVLNCNSHEGEATFWELEREKIELSHRLQLAEYRPGLNNSGDLQELERWQSLLSELKARLWNL